jgi:pimeloyl-ACP methyl ester carboxylesterase
VDTYFTLLGGGEPILLLHGWGTSSESLNGVAKALADVFEVYAIDLPGFGWSGAPPEAWGTHDYAAHVRAFMDRTAIPVASVVGHSFGGRIALALAARTPDRVRRLVLVASAGIRPRRGLGYHLKVGAGKIARRLLSRRAFGRFGARVIEEVSCRVGSRDWRTAGPLRGTLVKVVNEDLTRILGSIRAPTLIVWGDRDLEVGRWAMDVMANGIPGSRFEIIPGAGHFPFLDVPDRFADLVKAFLLEHRN